MKDTPRVHQRGRLPQAVRRRLTVNFAQAGLAATAFILALLWSNAHGLGALLRADAQSAIIGILYAMPLIGLFAVLAFAAALNQHDDRA